MKTNMNVLSLFDGMSTNTNEEIYTLDRYLELKHNGNKKQYHDTQRRNRTRSQ
jgi:hypothetical protein